MHNATKWIVINGIIIGSAFLIHAQFDYSRAWPLIWPFMGGIWTVYQFSQHTAITFKQGVQLGSRTGVVGALLAFVVGTPLHWFRSRNVMDETPVLIAYPLDGPWLIIAVTAAIALSCFVATLMGSILAAPISQRSS
jgi:hypothetical protein